MSCSDDMRSNENHEFCVFGRVPRIGCIAESGNIAETGSACQLSGILLRKGAHQEGAVPGLQRNHTGILPVREYGNAIETYAGQRAQLDLEVKNSFCRISDVRSHLQS